MKSIVKFEQTSLGGFPDHPNAQKNNGKAAARDTGINWSGYNEIKFEVKQLLEIKYCNTQHILKQ